MCCMCNEDVLGSGGAAIPCSWPTCSCLMCGAWCAPGSWSGGLLCRHCLGLQEQTSESQEMLGRASGPRETVKERGTNSREDRVQPMVGEREHGTWVAVGKSAVVRWRRSRKKGVYITECIDGFRGLEFRIRFEKEPRVLRDGDGRGEGGLLLPHGSLRQGRNRRERQARRRRGTQHGPLSRIKEEPGERR